MKSVGFCFVLFCYLKHAGYIPNAVSPSANVVKTGVAQKILEAGEGSNVKVSCVRC